MCMSAMVGATTFISLLSSFSLQFNILLVLSNSPSEPMRVMLQTDEDLSGLKRLVVVVKQKLCHCPIPLVRVTVYRVLCVMVCNK